MNDDHLHLMLPADRFYWAVIDTGSLPPRHRRDARSLGFLFENTLPLPIEHVHAVYQPLDRHRVVGCAMPKAELQALTLSNPEMLALGPQTVPPFVGDSANETAEMNLLTGPFEPRPIRLSRRRLVSLVIAAMLGLDGLVAVGFERRSASMRDQAAEIRAMQGMIMEKALGGVHKASTPTSQPPELQFVAELRTLRQTRRPPQSEADAAILDQTPRDVTPILAALTQFWPVDLYIQAESISIAPTSLTLRASAPASGTVQALADVLTLGDGWRPNQPQINTAPSGVVNATLQWKRGGGEPGTARIGGPHP